MDKTGKRSIFDRLEKDVEMADSTSGDSLVRIKKVSKPIRERLSDWDIKKKIERKSIEFSGILKSSPTNQVKNLNWNFLRIIFNNFKYFQPPRGVVKHRVNQRVILKKLPSRRRAVDMETDSEGTSDERMDAEDISKQVSFSPEVEVLEIESRRLPKINVNRVNRIKGLRADGIKDRLGAIKIHRNVDSSPSSSNIHKVRKTVSMKPQKFSSPVSKISNMRSDHISVPVKSRLDTFKNRSVSIQSRLSKGINKSKKDGSVFDRLGKSKIKN